MSLVRKKYPAQTVGMTGLAGYVMGCSIASNYTEK